MSKLPDALQIGPHRYRIVVTDHLYDSDNWGETSPRAVEIRLWDRVPDEALSVTLLHEVFHAVAHAWGVEELQDHSDGHLSSVTLDRLVRGIILALRDNPQLLKVLLSP